MVNITAPRRDEQVLQGGVPSKRFAKYLEDNADNSNQVAINTANITTNAAAITANSSSIADNAADIATNAAAITANTGNTSTNTGNITTNTTDIGTNTTNIGTNSTNIGTNTTNIATINSWLVRGAGTPEGVVTAVVGVLYQRTDGGASTTLYVKESGTGNTGWVAK